MKIVRGKTAVAKDAKSITNKSPRIDISSPAGSEEKTCSVPALYQIKPQQQGQLLGQFRYQVIIQDVRPEKTQKRVHPRLGVRSERTWSTRRAYRSRRKRGSEEGTRRAQRRRRRAILCLMIASNNIFVLSGIAGSFYAGSPSARFNGESNYGLGPGRAELELR